MDSNKKVDVPYGYRDINKVKTQMESFNKQKPFFKMTVNTVDEKYTFEKLTDETGKKNFQHLLDVAKKVFEPVLVW